MRKLILLTFTLLISALAFGQGIEFHEGNYKDAFNEAEAQDKLVFVDAFAVWCGPCKRMAAQVFPQKEVGDFFNTNFVNLKIDMEKGQGLDFRKIYPVSAFPTFFFIDGQGKVVHKFKGGRDVKGFIAEAKKAVGKFDQSAKYAKLWEEGNRDYNTAFQYIKGLNRSGKSSLKTANEYLSTQQNLGSTDNLKLIFEACTEVDSRIFDLLTQHKNALIEIFTVSKFEEKVVAASMNTFKKSLEFDSPSLEKLALNAVKKNAKSSYKGFALQCEMIKAEKSHDAKLYVQSASKYNKQVINNDVKEQKKLTEKLISRFSKEEEALKLANDIALELAKEKENCENCILVSNTYVKLKDIDSAKSWAYRAQLAAGEDKTQQLRVAQLIRRLESLN